MKNKVKHIIMTVVLSIACLATITGCGNSLEKEIKTAVENNQEIKLSVKSAAGTIKREPITWVELDQLKTFKDIRKVWDDQMQIVIFDMGSKNGVMYVDTDGNWAGNNVLFNIFQNKIFVRDFWSDSGIKSNLSQVAMNEFSDINGESTGIIASINSYFNILPIAEDGTSGLFADLTRAEAMAAIYRGDTPVIYDEVNSDFESAVSRNDYNLYAYGVAKDSYLKFENNGLNYDTYNSPITCAEVIYMLMHRYFPDELANVDVKSSGLATPNAGNIGEELGIVGKNAWESFELEYCLQYPEDGAPEELYKALVLANRLGLIASDYDWDATMNGGSLIQLMVNTYQAKQNQTDFLVSAKTGANVGQSLYIVQQPEPEIEEPEITESSLGGTTIQQVRDVTDLDDLFRIYGHEINMTDEEIKEAYEVASMFTFEPCDTWMQVDHCRYLNVRTGPSTDFRILKSVPNGTKAHLVARCVENGWYRVIADGKIIYQCGVYFSDFEGSENYEVLSGDNANKPNVDTATTEVADTQNTENSDMDVDTTELDDSETYELESDVDK